MDGKIIFKGKKNSVVKYFNSYLIIENSKVNDSEYIAYLWANGGTRFTLDIVVENYCKFLVDVDKY